MKLYCIRSSGFQTPFSDGILVCIVRVVHACMLQRDVVVKFGIWAVGTTVRAQVSVHWMLPTTFHG